MKNQEFYNIIDAEISRVLQEYKNDDYLNRNRNSVNNQKSYGLLIWFLEFYGRIRNYQGYITDGNDDSSCDIVFDRLDSQGKRVFYIVQSKWNNAKNALKKSDKDEILKALSDFEAILSDKKKNLNDKLKERLKDFQEHIKANGEVKFIFLSLATYDNNADENIQSFLNKQEKTEFEIIDLDRIKYDYIDRNFKKITPVNPLETNYNPEESPITIEVERFGREQGNFIKVERPFEAYVFLVRPKIIYELFEKYGFTLFFKNVRNPLLESQFNREIEETATENPAFFWYYNNGITAITSFLPTIRHQAEKIDITGFQVINGAQTVYSIYKAYKAATLIGRRQLNTEVLITLRLLKSGGRDFDLNVTRYTNSQNPIKDRDFYANDDIQIQLQNASYNTNIWYEKRRGEFRKETLPKGVRVIPNYVLANVYLAFHLQEPMKVIDNSLYLEEEGKDFNFISQQLDKKGTYEMIFGKATFEEMLSAFYVLDVFLKITNTSYEKSINLHFISGYHINIYNFIGIAAIVLKKYFHEKYGQTVNVNRQINEKYDTNSNLFFARILKFTLKFIENNMDKVTSDVAMKFAEFAFDGVSYKRIEQEIKDYRLKPNEIDNLEIGSDEFFVNGEFPNYDKK